MPKKDGVEIPEVKSTEKVETIGEQSLNFPNPEPEFKKEESENQDSIIQDSDKTNVETFNQSDAQVDSDSTQTNSSDIEIKEPQEGDVAPQLALELTQEENHKIQMGEVDTLPNGMSLNEYRKQLLDEQTRQEQERANQPMTLADLEKSKVSESSDNSNSTDVGSGTVNANSGANVGGGESGSVQ